MVSREVARKPASIRTNPASVQPERCAAAEPEAIGGVGDERRDQQVGVELVVAVVDLDEPLQGFDVPAQLREVEPRRPEPGQHVEPIDDHPPHGADGHPGGQRGDGQVEEASDRGGVRRGHGEPRPERARERTEVERRRPPPGRGRRPAGQRWRSRCSAWRFGRKYTPALSRCDGRRVPRSHRCCIGCRGECCECKAQPPGCKDFDLMVQGLLRGDAILGQLVSLLASPYRISTGPGNSVGGAEDRGRDSRR